jgi:hypothetical protein
MYKSEEDDEATMKDRMPIRCEETVKWSDKIQGLSR